MTDAGKCADFFSYYPACGRDYVCHKGRSFPHFPERERDTKSGAVFRKGADACDHRDACSVLPLEYACIFRALRGSGSYSSGGYGAAPCMEEE